MPILKFCACGDILLNEEIVNMGKEDPVFPFKYVFDDLKQCDIVFGNLECPLSTRGSPIKGKCCLYSPKKTVSFLKSAGFNLLSLANNHIFDYGFEGFEDTISLLDESKIAWCGAGKNLEKARKPAIISNKDNIIGFLSYSWDFIQSINANENQYGTAPLNESYICEDIKNLKTKVDFIVISLHWSYEREHYPIPSQRILAHKIIDAGADLIVGHHPHVIQGIEKYKHGLIVYSLGNFIFPNIFYIDYNIIQKAENKEAFIFQCEISKGKIISYSIIPITSNKHFQPQKLEEKDRKKLLDKINKYSVGFKSDNYSLFWLKNRIRKDLPDAMNQQCLISKMYKVKIIKFFLKFYFTLIYDY